MLTNIYFATKKLDEVSREKDPEMKNKIAETLDMGIEVMKKHVEKAQVTQEAYRAELRELERGYKV